MEYVSIDHVQLAMPESEEDTARAFYVGVLAFSELPKPESLRANGGAWFAAGGVQVHLGIDKSFVPARKAHPGIVVRDLAELERRCRAADVDVSVGSPIPGFRRIDVHDSFGNRLEFLEPSDAVATRES